MNGVRAVRPTFAVLERGLLTVLLLLVEPEGFLVTGLVVRVAAGLPGWVVRGLVGVLLDSGLVTIVDSFCFGFFVGVVGSSNWWLSVSLVVG